jgi:hypothetical protein
MKSTNNMAFSCSPAYLTKASTGVVTGKIWIDSNINDAIRFERNVDIKNLHKHEIPINLSILVAKYGEPMKINSEAEWVAMML